MKIAYICQSYPPMISGASIVVKQLAEGMADLGHEVLVCCASNEGSAYSASDTPVQLTYLRSFHNPFRVGQRFMVWPQKSLEAHLAAFDPDIIHIHDGSFSGHLGALIGQSLRKPAVLTLHQLPWFAAEYIPITAIKQPVENLLWEYGKSLMRKCERFITPTHTIGAIVEQETGMSVDVISNGIDLDKFFPQRGEKAPKALYEKYGLDPDLPVILHVGRIDPEKQVEIVVEASLRAMKTTNAQLLVVGDGKSADSIKALCAQSEDRDRCHFTGFVNPDEGLADLYKIASVFVMASEIETQGLVALEAAASGIPIVAADATCIPEIVHHGVNGFLVPPKDIAKMSQAIEKILNDPALADFMGKQATEIAETHDLVYTLTAHENLYLQVAAQPEYQSIQTRHASIGMEVHP